MKKSFYLFLVVLAVLAVSVSSVFAGSAKLHPYLGVKSVTESNIYLDAADEQSSAITTITPGFKLDWKGPKKNKLSIDANSENITYSLASSTNNAAHTNVKVGIKLNPGKLSIDLKDTYKVTTDPASSELTERIERNQNIVDLVVMLKLGKLSIGGGYKQNANNYTQDTYKPTLTRVDTQTDVIIDLAVSPKTSLLVEYGSGVVDYTEALVAETSNNSTFTQINVGVKGKLTGKTKGEIKFGSHSKTYDDTENKSDEDISTSILNISTLTKFSKRTKLFIGATKGLIESTYDNNYYYDTTGYSLNLDKDLGRIVGLVINASNATNAYPNANATTNVKREDVNTGYGVNLKFKLKKWLQLCGGYATKTRSSNVVDSSDVKIYDYTDNLVTIGLKAGL